MSEKIIGLTLCALLFVFSAPVAAQQTAKVPKIGWLAARGSGSGSEVFRRELRALGYVEGKNITIEYRYAENKLDQLPALADELVRLKVDALVTPLTAGALAAKNATRTTPIVFIGVGDPVASGLIDSLARPGGNITGLTTLRRCWLANDWSYSRKLFPSSPASRSCGLPESKALRNNGKKAN